MGSQAEIRLGVSRFEWENSGSEFLYSPVKTVKSGEEFVMEWQITGVAGDVLKELAVELMNKSANRKELVIDWIDFRGAAELELSNSIKIIHFLTRFVNFIMCT